jgi:hypothetical protein
MWPFMRKKTDRSKAAPTGHPPKRRRSGDGIDPLTLCPYGVFADEGDDRSRPADDPAPNIEAPAVEVPAPTETAWSGGGASYPASAISGTPSYDSGSSFGSYDSGSSYSGGAGGGC